MSEATPHQAKDGGQAFTPPDVHEHGAPREGAPQTMNRRLFMQLWAFEASGGVPVHDAQRQLSELMTERHLPGVIYEDVNHPGSFAVLSWSEDPAHFVKKMRPLFREESLDQLRFRQDLTMIGRTYSVGYEADLPFWLLKRPIETVLAEDQPWAVWYPLRRIGAFERLPGSEKGPIMREHAGIGKAYGRADLAHDVRLACHGLDASDNEFVIGLIGKELHPLSHVVQSMRKTKQTAEFMQQMGPFFVGYATWRSAGGQ